MFVINKLPAVAKSFVAYCTHCGADKFHTVLAHIDEDTAKVRCDICQRKTTFRLSQQGRSSSFKKVTSSRNTKGSGLLDNSVYMGLLSQYQNHPEKVYSAQEKYQMHDKIYHPKFKLGFVTRVMDGRIEVLFADQVRQLVCAVTDSGVNAK
ncbi:MAG: hypothetical protein NZ480_04630 [Bdellovibrionaceae bacterium]|nr:hypothetical protein [Pseudobdellovibrionaceae bacterium]